MRFFFPPKKLAPLLVLFFSLGLLTACAKTGAGSADPLPAPKPVEAADWQKLQDEPVSFIRDQEGRLWAYRLPGIQADGTPGNEDAPAEFYLIDPETGAFQTAKRRKFFLRFNDVLRSEEFPFYEVSLGEAFVILPGDYHFWADSLRFEPLEEGYLVTSEDAVWRIDPAGGLERLSSETYKGMTHREVWQALPGSLDQSLLKWNYAAKLSPGRDWLAYGTNRDCTLDQLDTEGRDKFEYIFATSLWLMNLKTGEEKRLVQSDGADIRPLIWLDEETLLYSQTSASGRNRVTSYHTITADGTIRETKEADKLTPLANADHLYLSGNTSSRVLAPLQFNREAWSFSVLWETDLGGELQSRPGANPSNTLAAAVVSGPEKGEYRLLILSLAGGEILADAPFPSNEKEKDVATFYSIIWLDDSRLFLNESLYPPLGEKRDFAYTGGLWLCDLEGK